MTHTVPREIDEAKQDECFKALLWISLTLIWLTCVLIRLLKKILHNLSKAARWACKKALPAIRTGLRQLFRTAVELPLRITRHLLVKVLELSFSLNMGSLIEHFLACSNQLTCMGLFYVLLVGICQRLHDPWHGGPSMLLVNLQAFLCALMAYLLCTGLVLRAGRTFIWLVPGWQEGSPRDYYPYYDVSYPTYPSFRNVLIDHLLLKSYKVVGMF
ncbi:hypothetical protein F5B20DRAFT_538637 [Whalleya microplaca]|nr:hypothetical protein F5B20DRAFT_538637 [Whalleya microplaca]